MLRPTPVTATAVVDTEARWLMVSLYGVALALYLYPIADLAFTMVPVRGDAVQWRYGAVAFAAQTLWSQLLALGLVSVVAFLLGHRIVLRLVAVYCVVLSLIIVAAMASAALDFVQLRRAASPLAHPKFDAGAMRLFAQCGLSVPILILLGMGSWKAGRGLASSRTKGDELGVVYSVGVKHSSRGAT